MEIFRQYQHIFAELRVIYWPWVWLQLWRVWSYSTRTGRQVVLNFDHCGRMHIVAVADAPTDAQPAYTNTAPPAPLWQSGSLMMDMPAFLTALAPSIFLHSNTRVPASPIPTRSSADRALIIPPWQSQHLKSKPPRRMPLALRTHLLDQA